MMITQEKMDQYRATAQARSRLSEKQRTERLGRATAVARQAAARLRTYDGVDRVVIFGSVAHPALFHERSDIDLAVWGLDERHYYRVVGELQALSPEFAIDLVRGEEVTDALRRTIEAEGMVL